jgi:hypothetical protein
VLVRIGIKAMASDSRLTGPRDLVSAPENAVWFRLLQHSITVTRLCLKFDPMHKVEGVDQPLPCFSWTIEYSPANIIRYRVAQLRYFPSLSRAF